MIELYDNQKPIMQAVRIAFRQYKSVLLVSPTGSGKTVMFCWMADRVKNNNKRVVILVHREELLDQVSETLTAFGVEHGIISPSARHERHHRVQVASVFTLARRLDRIDIPDMLIIDEAHHCCNGSTWDQVISHFKIANPDLYIMGVTATACRLGGEGLGVGHGGPFEHMVLGQTPRELIDAGRLSDYRLIVPPSCVDLSGIKKRGSDYARDSLNAAMSKPKIVGNAIEHYKKHCDGVPAVAFTVSVEKAEQVAADFRAAGYRAISVDGKLDKHIRREIVQDFKRGAINILTSCSLIDEGFDAPGIIAAIDMAPTLSLGRCMQRWGRVLRTASGKDKAIILDMVGNSGVMENGVFVPKHGLPDDPREWSLAGNGQQIKKKPDIPPPRICGLCFAANRAGATICKVCKQEFPVEGRQVDQVDGELSEVDAAREKREARIAQGMAKDLESLTSLGRMRGYKDPMAWARHVIAGREKKKASG